MLRVSLALALAAAPPLTWTDSYGDGTPDRIRLRTRADQEAFRDWFRYLAELQAFRPSREWPPELTDCAALVRFAYREALRPHDSAWLQQAGLSTVPPLGEIRAVHYPFPGLGAGLFRVRDGDSPAAFAQFADAQTLLRRNVFFVSRDLRQARPGDLLFFRQLVPRQPYHSMIFLGDGLVRPEKGPFVVYHTGPMDDQPGEIRRPSLDELMRHPEPRWRPTPGNSNFLGIYRWNILRDPS